MPPPTANHLPQLDSSWVLESQNGASLLPIARFPAILGRRPNADLCVPEPSVSGHHAEFTCDGRRLLVRDLASTNGTFVNGRRIETTPQSLASGDLLHFGEAMFRVGIRIPGEGNTINLTRCALDVCDQALALVQFDRLLSARAVTPYFQPIVTAAGEPFAYEVLGRSPLFGLNTPAPMFRAAATLNKETELSHLLRVEAMKARFGAASPHLFLNTHPRELAEVPPLIAALSELRRLAPERTMTLEIHESAAVDAAGMRSLRAALTDLRIGLAYDDFGAGQARLAELVETSPEFVKFDMRLIRGIHAASEAQRKMVGSLVQLVNELGITSLAEGIEAAEELDACRQLGFHLFQGFHCGRPGAATQYFKADCPLAP
jgi:EAL domain-containing protein (putative c-di-GMP-specific phosphodiesterase class I)